MTTNLNTQTNQKSNAWIGGAILIGFGVMALIGNFTNLPGHLFLFAPGLVFLAWGLVARHNGPIIPGSILTGVGTGVYLVTQPSAAMSETALGASVLLPLAGGFFPIALLSLYTERGLAGRVAFDPRQHYRGFRRADARRRNRPEGARNRGQDLAAGAGRLRRVPHPAPEVRKFPNQKNVTLNVTFFWFNRSGTGRNRTLAGSRFSCRCCWRSGWPGW